MVKGIVFDLDGTLVDSPLCFDSIRTELGIPKDEYILEFLDFFPPVERALKLRRLEEIELEAARKATPFPHVLDLLREIVKRKIHVGIFTRNCRVATRHVIEAHGMKIDHVVTREDAPPKPDPTGVFEFLKIWNLKPLELLYVGDYRFDIECGKKAGVRTALFTNRRTLIEDWQADLLVHEYARFWEHLSAGR